MRTFISSVTASAGASGPLINYLLTVKAVGLLINFNVLVLKSGVKKL